MRVLFVGRSTLFTHYGGDTTQMVETAEHLRKLGIDVVIRTADEPVQHDFDILHFFNIIRPGDALKYTKTSKKPMVVSPIYVDYSLYDQNDRRGIQRLLSLFLSKHVIEYLKGLIKIIKGQEKLHDASYLLGHKRAMQNVIRRSSMLLPNSESEASRLSHDLQMQFDYRVVPNAINTSIFYPDPKVKREENLVLSVGQFDGRKNQHRLIEALANTDVKLILVGKAGPNSHSYLERCKSMAGPNVSFIDFLSPDELRLLYSQATVHALPAWFETTGLTSLEAGACGCKLVVSTGGDTADYFKGIAHFCSPESIDSIRKAVIEALNGKDLEASLKINSDYTWEITAQKTLAAYHEALK